MQKHLGLEIKAFYSRDKDEIFIKIRASEENLKVQADLMDYRLQFKTRKKESKFPFKKWAPYAPFEKDQEATLGIKLGGSKERNFKKYDENEQESPDGTTFFRNVDRVRLIYSTMTESIDLSTL